MPLAAIAGIGAIGSIVGGVVGSNAAGHAADTQAAAANNAAQLESQSAANALNFNKQQYGNSLSLLSPFYNTGVSANSRLAYLMGLNPAQGLPAGVVNPNAPSATSTGPRGGFMGGGNGPTPRGNGSNFFNPKSLTSQPEGMFPGGAPPDPNDLGAGGADFNRFGQMEPNAGGAGVPLPTGGTSSFNTAAPITSPPGTGGMQFQMRPPITSPGTGTQGQINPPITSPGAGGPYQMQMRPPIMSGGAAGMLNPDGSTGTDFNPAPNGTPLSYNPQSVTNATTNQGGTGQVPQGGVAGPDGTVGLGDPSPFGSGGIGDLNGGQGSFGSLAQGWNQTFQSPNAVTEQNDPGYQFRLQQGQQALQNSAAARGGLLSGGTAKALTDYNQNAASGEYGNVYNRALQNYNTNYNTFTNDQTNTFNRLMALQSGGQVSANNLSASGITAAGNAANIGLTSAGQIGQQYNNAGAANASGYINQANAINGAIGGAGNSLSTLAMLRLLQNGGAGAGAGGGGV